MPAEYKNDPNPILLDSTTINEHIDLLLYNIFCYRRRFVTEVLLPRRFVTGDVLLHGHGHGQGHGRGHGQISPVKFSQIYYMYICSA
jgi:hypothetical protein